MSSMLNQRQSQKLRWQVKENDVCPPSSTHRLMNVLLHMCTCIRIHTHTHTHQAQSPISSCQCLYSLDFGVPEMILGSSFLFLSNIILMMMMMMMKLMCDLKFRYKMQLYSSHKVGGHRSLANPLSQYCV